MIEYLVVKPGDDILDVGGGTVILLPMLHKAAGDKGKVVSLDIAEEMLKLARNNGYLSNIHYIHADAAAIQLEIENLELVI